MNVLDEYENGHALDANDFLLQLGLRRDEEAYHNALQDLYGAAASDMILNVKDGDGRFNKISLVKKLRGILSWDGLLAFERFASTQVPMGGMEEWRKVFHQLGPSSHPIHFCHPSEEGRLMLEFLDYSLKQGENVKVVALWYGNRTDSMAHALADRGHKGAVKSGQLTFLGLEKLKGLVMEGGSIARATGILDGLLVDALERKGYSEVRFGGSMSGVFFRNGRSNLAVNWEEFLDGRAQNLKVAAYCTFPVLGEKYRYEAFRRIVGNHNWAVIGTNAYPIALAS